MTRDEAKKRRLVTGSNEPGNAWPPERAGQNRQGVKVKVLNVEGLAIHNVPESCALAGNRPGEALTGVRAGRVLSRESSFLRGADAVGGGGRQHRVRRYREAYPNPARSETSSTHGCTLYGNREIPLLPARDGTAGRIGKSKDVRR
jgi:hypothetical protein